MYIFLTILGAVTLFGFIKLVQKNIRFMKHGVVVEGEIVGFDEHESVQEDEDGEKHTVVMYSAVVRYTTKEGGTLTKAADLSESNPSQSVGDPIRVSYLKDSAEEPQIGGKGSQWIGPVILFFFGALIFASGVLGMMKG